MNRKSLFWLLVALLGLSFTLRAAEFPATVWDRYIWETCHTENIAPAASNLVAELRMEVQKVLDAGPLAPVRTVYADLEQDPYFMYWQPGRVITTLAAAWPQLGAQQQASVRQYVRAELVDERRAPWNPQGFIPPDKGARRELHAFSEARGWDRYWAMWGSKKPIMGSFYGLWHYAHCSADWEALQPYYPRIAGLYGRLSGQCNLYGTMSAHVAMARIARHFADEPTRRLAVSNAGNVFTIVTNFAAVEAATQTYWKERYEPRQRNQNYQGWMFLDLSPEIGRYLADHVKAAILQRHNAGLKRFPLFWLRESPYSSRWTGDEGIGVPTELMGMLVPVERWVAGVPSETLAGYVRSAPDCIGDCYWIEALVHAIEATGETKWIGVKE